MDTRYILLVESLQDVVRSHAPQPDECCYCRCYEKCRKKDDEGEANAGHDEEDGAYEADYQASEDGEDDNANGHDNEEAERKARKSDMGGYEGLWMS